MESLVLAAVLVMLLAAAVQAVTGFGFALVAIPLLALTADPRTAVVSVGVAGLAMTVMAAVRERRHARWSTAGLLVAASVVGMPAGLLVLRSAPARVLTLLIGAGVIGCALLIWRGLRLPNRRPVVVGVGILAGALATATGTNGPPLVAALQAMGYAPRAFRATLAVTFTGSGLLALTGFGLTGQFTPEVLMLGGAGIPATLVGWWLGDRVFHRLDPERFRRLLLWALVGCGVLIIAPVPG
ncbi:MAG TPA: sulfite exporter TauE/SafE family protein [Natronosporangium sp.]|nr:sulfite exporter TauE/SafE family protein [Natronosporangium sp.]